MNRTLASLLTLCVLVLGTSIGCATHVVPRNRTSCDVVHFGAVADGTTNNTEAFQKALNFAAAGSFPAGGDVIVPPGNFLIGSIILPAGVTLHLSQGATLTGSP